MTICPLLRHMSCKRPMPASCWASCGPARNVGLQPCWVDGVRPFTGQTSQGLGPRSIPSAWSIWREWS